MGGEPHDDTVFDHITTQELCDELDRRHKHTIVILANEHAEGLQNGQSRGEMFVGKGGTFLAAGLLAWATELTRIKLASDNQTEY
jgi:hypothetical protein